MKKDDKIVEVLYEDKSFEQYLSYINELIKIRAFTSSPNGSVSSELESVLKKYLIVFWSIKAYADLITDILSNPRKEMLLFA